MKSERGATANQNNEKERGVGTMPIGVRTGRRKAHAISLVERLSPPLVRSWRGFRNHSKVSLGSLEGVRWLPPFLPGLHALKKLEARKN